MVRIKVAKKEMFALADARSIYQHACKNLQSIRLLVTELEPNTSIPHNAAVTFYLPVGKKWADQAVGSLQFYGQNKFINGVCSCLELRFYYKFLNKAPALAAVIYDTSLPFRVEPRIQYEAFHFTSPNQNEYILFIDRLTKSINVALEKDFGNDYKALNILPIRETAMMLPILKD